MGEFESTAEHIEFRGRPLPPPGKKTTAQGPTPPSGGDAGAADDAAPPATRSLVGQAICNRRFAEGSISVDIEFSQIDSNSVAEIMLQYDTKSEEMLTVGLGGEYGSFYSLRLWTSEEQQEGASSAGAGVRRNAWKYLHSGGERSNLKAGYSYHLDISVQGSMVTLKIDDVEVFVYQLGSQLPGAQMGVFCISKGTVFYRNLAVAESRPQAFVVMQFNSQEYEDLFRDVIEPVCDSMRLKAYRADQTYSPGLVVADIQNQIAISRVVIAEITPINANVYYEVGYADALKKPVILIADKRIKELPFDVRPYRTIFYENTIGGKGRVEEALRKYLTALAGGTSITL